MEMPMALKMAVLRHIRVSVDPVSVGWASARFCSRLFSSHAGLDKADVTERVLSVIKDYPKVDPSKVLPTAHFYKDLGLDSLDTVELVFALEEEFGFEMPDKDADKIDSCAIAIDYIAAHPAAR
eukprot:TRINITY_DN40770_c0_g1_i1.p1 TRINITY_DN40770_c0_g1~~TRINITY_DN40770_c0_g1_i1.p1  ORF type:complete len:124 (+),score=20.25 TRINITY_DN40770_c0_g1_i1:88-459(+)